MRESRAWKYLSEHCPPWLAIERLEPMYPPGLPDCFWTDMRPMGHSMERVVLVNVSGWLELKYCEPDDREFKAGRIPKLKPSQPQFLRRQRANGVPGGILLRVGKDRWYLWKSHAEHEWVSEVCSTVAMSMAQPVFDSKGLQVEFVINYIQLIVGNRYGVAART